MRYKELFSTVLLKQLFLKATVSRCIGDWFRSYVFNQEKNKEMN